MRHEKSRAEYCACGAPLEPSKYKPRVRCVACAAEKGALAKAWRLAHSEQVAAYNLARRVMPQLKPCAECGRTFTPARKDTLVCSYNCRLRRKSRLAYGYPHPF